MVPGTAFSSVLTAAKTGAEWALSALYADFQPKISPQRCGSMPRED
jgi:hypothetical protein